MTILLLVLLWLGFYTFSKVCEPLSKCTLHNDTFFHHSQMYITQILMSQLHVPDADILLMKNKATTAIRNQRSSQLRNCSLIILSSYTLTSFDDFQYLSSPGKVVFTDPGEVIHREVKKLKEQSVDIIILLSHCGLRTDRFVLNLLNLF